MFNQKDGLIFPDLIGTPKGSDDPFVSFVEDALSNWDKIFPNISLEEIENLKKDGLQYEARVKQIASAVAAILVAGFSGKIEGFDLKQFFK